MSAAKPIPRCDSRRAAQLAACRSAGIPTWDADLRTVPGHCPRRRCGSRFGVIRFTLDFRPDRIDRTAIVECAACGRAWRRVREPRLRTNRGQSVRFTAILPATVNRWLSRGVWHREGDDALVLVDASLGEISDAAREHARRTSAKDAAIARRKAREAEADAAAVAQSREVLAAMDARRAAREAEEREAEAAAQARERL